jgi:hypothetical protein
MRELPLFSRWIVQGGACRELAASLARSVARSDVQERCQSVRKRVSVLAAGVFERVQRLRNAGEAKRMDRRYIAHPRATKLFARFDGFVWW